MDELWTSGWRTGVAPVDARWTTVPSSPAVRGARANLWLTGDDQGTQKSRLTSPNADSSTIHRTYYRYYQNFVLY